MTSISRFKILFLCTGNSARSIFAEFIAKNHSSGRFDAVSAGSSPKEAPHPLAIKILKSEYGFDTTTVRSKSWDEFKDQQFDFVITLCDKAREACPVWLGQPVVAHWGSPDPSEEFGTREEQEHFFWQVSHQIKRRIDLFASLPFESLDRLRLETATKEIGQQSRSL